MSQMTESEVWSIAISLVAIVLSFMALILSTK